MKNHKEIEEILKATLTTLESARVPEELRPIAFERTFDALLASLDGEAATALGTTMGALAETTPEPLENPSLERIASRLGLDVDLVREIYHSDGEELGLAVAPSSFDSRKAVGAVQIALLVAAGRQAGGWEEWTPVGFIRDVCRDYGRLDSANFATTIKRMADIFSFRGRGRQVEVRVTRPGYERAAALAREMRGA
jgi:hypothetical protein